MSEVNEVTGLARRESGSGSRDTNGSVVKKTGRER